DAASRALDWVDSLRSAARAYEAILRAREPEYVWVVKVGEGERHDAQRRAAALDGKVDVGAVAQDAHPRFQREDVAAPAGPPDDDGAEQAAQQHVALGRRKRRPVRRGVASVG